MANLNIPVGVSDFAEIRKNGYYFIDKSELIEKLVKTKATKVTLDQLRSAPFLERPSA